MSSRARATAAAVLLAGLVVASASGAADNKPLDGRWRFTTKDQDQPDLSFADAKRTIFDVSCGARFMLWVVHPLSTKQAPKTDDDVKVTFTIGNGKTKREFTGLLQAGFGDTRLGDHYPETTVYVVQTDLGYDHLSSYTYSDKWRKEETELLDFLDAGAPLTISAEGASYTLPRIGIADWKRRFRKIC